MPEIEFVTLANHAEAVNGLLYLSGAGWSDHWRAPGPENSLPPTHLGIGISVLVPWTETNRRHHLVVIVEGEDGGAEFVKAEADLEVGRPPGLPPGTDLRAVLALNADVALPEEGAYRIVATLGQKKKSVTFRVHNQPPGGGFSPVG